MNEQRPSGDVRGFYATLGVLLPGGVGIEVPVRCFTDPEAHARGDRSPSCSVNLVSGAFNCHGCGAHGGAYDAALALGRTPRDAIDLMIAHRLTERRAGPTNVRTNSRRSVASQPAAVRGTVAGEPSRRLAARSLEFGNENVGEWARALVANPRLLGRLRAERGWEPGTLRRWGIGFDGQRITVPITDQDGTLQGLLRLRVQAWQKPKVLAATGSRLGLIPHPKLVSGPVVLVEGPGDMLAARSRGLSAVAVPGTQAWRAEWAAAFTDRDVTVVMDADRPGRDAAIRITHDLKRHGARPSIVDLDPSRDDGYDLSDWLRAGHDPAALPTGRPVASNVPGSSARTRPQAISHRPLTVTAHHATPAAARDRMTVSRPGGGRCAAF